MDFIQDLESLITPYLEREGLRLYKIKLITGGKRKRVEVFLDGKDGGVTIDKLAAANRYIGDLMEAEELLNESYLLEVSSPGLVTLKEDRDFHFFMGRYCRIVLEEKTVYGYLKSYDNGVVVVKTKDNGELAVEKSRIVKAKLDVDF
jgi:ribosome maturation factor RimP